ncbi:MAG: glutamine--fructose-6-phosphate transaminase (isomerizing) [Epsilonproteobacteria bacterium]|nr:glutamine--fructose-6-phosphate transaminase (isomerizing) [Campylobacterota bacterium]
MCGIVGYIGNNNIKKQLLDGLKELEYRGYDSAGFSILKDGEIYSYKAVGKITNLAQKAKDFEIDGEALGIAHTRWATHGKPTEINAHPHFAEFSAVVHNGIIENYQSIKQKLQKEGIEFLSQTDTETIVKLFEYHLKNDSFEAFKQTINELHGAYAILLLTKKEPDTMFFAKMGSPLLIAKNDDEIFFASSDAPVIGKAKEVIYLEDGDYGYIKDKKIHLFRDNKEINLSWTTLPQNKEFAKKEGFRFFMEKEIYEQSSVLQETLMGRIDENGIYFEEIDKDFFEGIRDITICACGTSYHAGMVGSYLIQRNARIKTNVEIGSEFRYKNPILNKDTLFIVISQSGETADTLEALKMAKNAGLKTLAICNVDNSSIVRLANKTLLTRAGIEKGVASTKAFATQVMVLWLLANYLGNKNENNIIMQVSKVCKVNDKLHEKIKRLSKRYLHGHGFFFIGRDVFYPLALEGALKLKEISYLHAEGYPAGEMKHGPIALADPELYTIALLSKNLLFEKTKSNIEELSSRDSTILTISSQEIETTDDFIKINSTNHYMLEFYEMMVITQLLAMEISIRLGNDVDMPRNLAKSVTVE